MYLYIQLQYSACADKRAEFLCRSEENVSYLFLLVEVNFIL